MSASRPRSRPTTARRSSPARSRACSRRPRRPDELLVVDDGSTDDTPGRARAATATGIRVVRAGERRPLGRAQHRRPRGARAAASRSSTPTTAGCRTSSRARCRCSRRSRALGIVHGHVDVIDGDGALAPRRRPTRHRALFSRANARITYAGWAFDCRCFSSAHDRAGRRDPRRSGGYDTGAPARRLRPLPAARARLRDPLPRGPAGGALPPPRGADDDVRADDGADPDRREAPRAARPADRRARRAARAAQLPAHARAQPRGARAPARVARASCCARCGSTPASSARAGCCGGWPPSALK